MDDVLAFGMAVIVGIESVLAIVAAGYIVRVYRARHEDAPFLTRLVKRDVRVAAGGLLITIVVVYSLVAFAFEWDFIPRPWASVLIGLGIALMEYGVISDAIVFYRERSR